MCGSLFEQKRGNTMDETKTIEDQLADLQKDVDELKAFRKQVDDTVKEWPGLATTLAEHGIRLKKDDPAVEAEPAAEEGEQLP